MPSHDKPILYQTPNKELLAGSPDFSPDKFDQSISVKGYTVEVEKALKCPCFNFETGQSLLDCVNCGGLGWIFINKKETRAVIIGMSRMLKYENWSELDMGSVSMTFRSVDPVAFMDRVVNKDLLSTHSERLFLRTTSGDLGAMLVYPVITTTNAFLFKGNNLPLQSLVDGVDFTIENNRYFILSPSVNVAGLDEVKVSIRYEHNPVFHIKDVLRERMANRGKNCVDELQVNQLPIHCTAQRAHIMFDAPGKNFVGLVDNSSLDNEIIF